MEKLYRESHNHIKIWSCKIQDHPAHFHDEIEIIFLLDGTVTAFCDGYSYELKSGDIFLCASNQIHSYRHNSEIYDSILLIIDPNLLYGSTSELSKNAPAFPVFSDPQKKSLVWEPIKKLISQQATMDSESIRLLLSGILSTVLNCMGPQKNTIANQNIQRMVTYCRQHYKEPITIDSICSELYLSRSYISHTFSNVLKISFPDYINGLRLKEATRLLKYTKMNITEIAMQSGFPTSRSFNRVFMKEHGVSPSQFRKRQRINNDPA